MLLIIQNGNVIPCIYKYLDEEYEIIKSFEKDVSDISVSEYSIIVILGGYQSVTNIYTHPYLVSVVSLIKKCLKQKKPLLGICLGCQLIAYTLGCKINSSSKLNIGYDTDILGQTNVFRSHIDYVVPNDSIEVLEYYDNMPYLYKHDNFCYGIQCHPDMPPECVKRYCPNKQFHKYATDNYQLIENTNRIIIKYLFDKLRNIN